MNAQVVAPTIVSAVLALFLPLVCSAAAGSQGSEDPVRTESWVRDAGREPDAAAVPSINRLPRVAMDSPLAPGTGVTVAGFPMTRLMPACAPEVHPDTLWHLVRRASEAEPWSVGNPGQTFYAASSAKAAAELVARLEGEGVNCTVGLLQLPASVLRDEGVEPALALDPCVNLRVGARILLRQWQKALQESPEAPRTALAMSLLAFEEITRSRAFVGIVQPQEATGGENLAQAERPQEPDDRPEPERPEEAAPEGSGPDAAAPRRKANSGGPRRTAHAAQAAGGLIRIPGGGAEKAFPAGADRSRQEAARVLSGDSADSQVSEGSDVPGDGRLIF